MVGLKGARVLVLDDEQVEAGAVLRALSRSEIAAVWFNGDKAELPSSPLKGIRLALLDVDLTNAGLDSKQLAAALANTVQSLIDPGTAGLSIVLWTKHGEVKDQFLDHLLKAGGPIPVLVDVLAKNDFKDPITDEFDLRKLTEHLTGALALVEPWPTVLAWEGSAHLAASDAFADIVELSQLGTKPSSLQELDAWQRDSTNQLAKLLHVLAVEELGKDNVTGGQRVLEGALAVAGALVADRAEGANHSLAAARGPNLDVLFNSTAELELMKGIGSRINARLVLSTDGLDRVWTGNLYDAAEASLSQHVKALCGDAGVAGQYANVLAAGKEEKRGKNVETIRGAVLGEILIEVNPNCDHAQGKALCGKFLTAVKIKSLVFENTNVVKSPESLWKCGPIFDQKTNETYHIVCDARLPLIVSKANLSSATPSARLRQVYAGELLARSGAHGARPGTVIIHQ